MEKAITIINTRTFEEKALNDAVKGLQKAFTNIDKNRKDACIIMWRLEDGKKYEKDGFKSLQEFAETIGIDKSTAHKMADAGRVYDSKVPAIAQFADQAGYTNSATLASMLKNDQSDMIEKAIESGDLTPDMTADKVKSWKADTIAQSKPEKVVPNWHIVGDICSNDPTLPANEIWASFDLVVGISDPKDWAREFYTDSLVSVAVVPADGTKVYMAVTPDGSMFRYTAKKVKKEKKPVKKSGKDLSKEELEALIAEYKSRFGDDVE